MYKEITRDGQTVIFRESDSAWIPTNLGNADYAEFLRWVSEGNTPEAVVE
jgi:hypothetical protein